MLNNFSYLNSSADVFFNKGGNILIIFEVNFIYKSHTLIISILKHVILNKFIIEL